MWTHPLPPLDSGASFSSFGVFVFEIWVLRFRSRVLRFRDLGVFVFDRGCFVFEIWVLRASVFVFECFVFETTVLDMTDSCMRYVSLQQLFTGNNGAARQ